VLFDAVPVSRVAVRAATFAAELDEATDRYFLGVEDAREQRRKGSEPENWELSGLALKRERRV
jgi:hypothetical protein